MVVALAFYSDGKLFDELASFRWELFPLALALTTVNYLLRFWRWERYLKRVDIHVPFARSLSIFTAGLTMTITPAKLGELLKCALLHRSFDVPVRRSAPVVLAERVTDASGVVVVVRSPLLDRVAFFGEATEASRSLLTVPLFAGMTLLSAVSWFFESLAAYVCVRGLHLDLSLGDTVVVFSLGSLVGAASFLPGGLGAADASMTGLIRLLGDTTKAAAAAATVLIRLATLWYGVALGLIGLAVEERLARNQPVRRSSMR